MVKKCPDPACGFEGEGNCCSECGKKLIENPEPLPSTIIVFCNGKTDDGQLCGATLNPKKKFCSNCGLQIDPSLFEVKKDVILCQECGAKMASDEKFCSECGAKVQKPVTKGI